MPARKRRPVPSYRELAPASAASSRAAQGSSRKTGTRCELALRRALRARGVRFTTNGRRLPGSPDLVFRDARVVVFCDGDFWHGRRLRGRLRKLAAGHNAPYWIAKIQRNVARDRLNTRTLRAAGWTVLRFWETDILERADALAATVERTIASRLLRSGLKHRRPASRRNTPAK